MEHGRTQYQKGCRCSVCVDANRATARKSQVKRYWERGGMTSEMRHRWHRTGGSNRGRPRLYDYPYCEDFRNQAPAR